MRVYADFVPCHLIRPSARVFGCGGGETLDGFCFGDRISGARRTDREFLFVVLEVIIDALQFAAQMLQLTVADGGEIGGQVFLQRHAEEFPPARRIGLRPGNGLVALHRGLRQVQSLGEGVVRCPVRQGNRHAPQRPMLINRLNFTPQQRQQ